MKWKRLIERIRHAPAWSHRAEEPIVLPSFGQTSPPTLGLGPPDTREAQYQEARARQRRVIALMQAKAMFPRARERQRDQENRRDL